jgi:sigma-E factor negative regulatory protein RseA
MNDNLRQSLSALMDDEADDLELRRLLAESAKDDRIRETWSRYQLARQLMSEKSKVQDITIDLSDGIRRAIDREEALSVVKQGVSTAEEGRHLPAWLKPLGGVAVAASVALVTVFGVTQYNAIPVDTGAVSATALVAEISPVNPATVSGMSTVGGQYAQPASYSQQKITLEESIHQVKQNQAVARKKLDTYLLRHAEHAALNNSHGLMPLARVVEY